LNYLYYEIVNMDNEILFEFISIPKKLVILFENKYQNKKKQIIKEIKEEIYNEYGIDIRD